MAIAAYLLGVLIALTSVAALGLKLEKLSRPDLQARAGVERSTVAAAPAAVPTDATARRRQRAERTRR